MSGDNGSPPERAIGTGGGRVLPARHSILASASVRAAICDAYGLTGLTHCRLLKTSLNDTYLVAGRDGRYVARIYRPSWRSLDDIRYELDLLVHLAATGVPVAPPIARPDGGLTFALDAPEGARYLALFDHVPGAPASWDRDEHCHRLGHLAATIHSAASNFRTPHRRFRLDLDQLVDVPVTYLAPFLSHRRDDWDFVTSFGSRVRVRASALLTDGADWGPCHGDFHVNNVHVSSAGMITALDFDWCAPGWRAYDLTSVYRASRRPEHRFRWNSFLRGYSKVRRLRPEDLAAVPILRVLRSFMMFAFIAGHVDLWGARPIDDKLDRLLVSLREWEVEHSGELPASGAPRVFVNVDIRADRPRVCDRAGAATSVRYTLLAPEAIAGEMAQMYALEQPVTARLLARGLHDSYVLTAGADRYIARVHRRGDPSAAEIGYEIDLLAHLTGKGVPVVLPVAAADGSTVKSLAAPEGARPVVLFAWAPGMPLTWDRAEDARELGEMIARVHATSDDFRSQHPRSPLDLDTLVERNLRAFRAVLPPDSEEWDVLRRFAQRLQSATERALGEGLDWGACHGDLSPTHLHRGPGRTTIFGFDRAAPGWRAYDFSIIRWGSSSSRGAVYWAQFVSGYRQVRPLTTANESSVPLFYGIRRFSAIATVAANAEDCGGTRVHKALAEELSFFRDWEPTTAEEGVDAL
jgi:Ser/Thr protein kinase RdoA (MazF antagonist)